MDGQAGGYKKLGIKRFPARAQRETAEGKYWRGFKAPVVIPQHGPVTSIDFTPSAPYHFIATASTRVLMYEGASAKQLKQFSRFKDVAYSGVFRGDAKVMAAGGESKMVQVFDVQTKAILRQLKGHTRAVRAVGFCWDKVRVVSGSDDASVRVWDVAGGEEVGRWVGHQDYVRSLAASPESQDLWASGSYDHTLRLWDARSASCSMQVSHGAPIEAVCWFPSGSLVVSAGGPCVCVWDVLTGRRLAKLTNHQKAVMALQVLPDVGPPSSSFLGEDQDYRRGATRLITGSLDGHVKVYECDAFKVQHVAKYPGGVASLGLAPDCSLLAVGLANGSLSVRQRAKPRQSTLEAHGGAAVATVGSQKQGGGQAKQAKEPSMRTGVYKYFLRGRGEKAGAGDFQVAAQRQTNLSTFDKHLKHFRLSQALDAALTSHKPEVVVSVIEELIARGGLQSAISGRHADSLMPLLDFLTKYVAEPRYSCLLAEVTEAVLDVYGQVVGQSPSVDGRLRLMQDRLQAEVRLQQELQILQGTLEPILTGALA